MNTSLNSEREKSSSDSSSGDPVEIKFDTRSVMIKVNTIYMSMGVQFSKVLCWSARESNSARFPLSYHHNHTYIPPIGTTLQTLQYHHKFFNGLPKIYGQPIPFRGLSTLSTYIRS